MSFRALTLPAYLALALSAGWLASLAVSPRARHAVQATRPYDFAERIAAENPDVILVGNSMVYRNVDEAALEKALSARVFFAAEGATGSAWWYLILKNQIAPAARRGATVVLMTTDAELTRYHDALSARELWTFSKLGADEAFLAKVGARYRRALSLYARLPDRVLVAKHVLGLWIAAWRPWEPAWRDGRAVLAARLDVVEPRPFDVFKAAEPDAADHALRACLKPAECGDETLLPDLVAAASPFRLVVVDAARAPGTKDWEAGPAYRKELAGVLALDGAALISLRERKELRDPRLWSDTKHLTAEGMAINTRLLAAELAARGLER